MGNGYGGTALFGRGNWYRIGSTKLTGKGKLVSGMGALPYLGRETDIGDGGTAIWEGELVDSDCVVSCAELTALEANWMYCIYQPARYFFKI